MEILFPNVQNVQNPVGCAYSAPTNPQLICEGAALLPLTQKGPDTKYVLRAPTSSVTRLTLNKA